MPQTSQTYKNHVRWFPPFHFFVAPVLLLNFVNVARIAWVSPSGSTAFAALVAAALFGLALLTRAMVATVQDRIIRLEMRLRLREVLPHDLQGQIGELTCGQLVALRFASDAELPELVRQVLAGVAKTKRDIKVKIQKWQGDYLRA